MPQKIHKNHIKRRSRATEKPKPNTLIIPEDALQTDSGFIVSGFKGDFETLTEHVTAGGVSTIRLHDFDLRIYRIEAGFCLFVMIDKNTGEKTEVVGSPGTEICVPAGFAHYIKGHVEMPTTLYVVQGKDFEENLIEQANAAQVTPFAETLANYTPQAPQPRKRDRSKKSKAAEQNKKAMAKKGHISTDQAETTGLSGLMKMASAANFKPDNQKPSILSGRDLRP